MLHNLTSYIVFTYILNKNIVLCELFSRRFYATPLCRIETLCRSTGLVGAVPDSVPWFRHDNSHRVGLQIVELNDVEIEGRG